MICIKYNELMKLLKNKYGEIYSRMWANYPDCIFYYNHPNIDDCESAGAEIAIYNLKRNEATLY